MAFLASIPKAKRQKMVYLAPSLPVHGVWMVDVSAIDRRSIKAQLAGRGDGRAMWWNLCAFVLQRCYREHKLEWAMYRFHQFHNELHLLRLDFVEEVRSVLDDVKRRGFARAMKSYCFGL